MIPSGILREGAHALFRTLEPWQEKTGWFHYHHEKNPKHQTHAFPESTHHNGFAWSALGLLDIYDPEFNLFLISGVQQRIHPELGFLRDPKIFDSPVNADQMQPLLWPIHLADPKLAHRVYELTKDQLKGLPHHKAHYQRSLDQKPSGWLRFISGIAEVVDTLFDIVSQLLIPLSGVLKFLSGRNGVDSSIIKNVHRHFLAVKTKSGFLTGLNWWLIKKFLDPEEAFNRYFTHKIHGDDNPLPVHLLWVPVFQAHREGKL